MKKNFKNFLLMLLLVSITGTGILMALEYLIGPAELFIGCCITVFVVGMSIIFANLENSK